MPPYARLTLIGWVLIFGAAPAARAQGGAPNATAALEQAAFQDYRDGVGRLEGGVLRVTLEARSVAWRPWGDSGPTLRTHVYAADGAAPRTPGPLIRVKVGTPVHVTVRNQLEDPLVMRGLRDRGAIPAGAPPFAVFVADSVAVAPRDSLQMRFTPTETGTFCTSAERSHAPAARRCRRPSP